MKKTLLLLASAAMLLVGCAKEKLGPEAGTGEMVTANFTAQMQGMPQTKSVTDGAGTKANRCVMEIYYQGVLYTRDVQTISNMTATFTPRLVSNRTYDVLFWADCGEGLADKYYTTNAEGLGLQAVEMKATSYAANDDARDAFYTKDTVLVRQQVSSKKFKLTRPFAQVNIITTDAAIIKNGNLYPDGVKMVYTAPTKFNLLSGELSKEKELTVKGTPYEAFVATSPALTLEMDYLFASSLEQSALDIAFEASKTGETAVTKHSFTNIPVKRNFRTNIKGALLTTTGDWTATIVPGWNQPDEEVAIIEAGSVAAANEAFANGATRVKITSVGEEKTLYLPQTTEEVTIDFTNPSEAVTVIYGPAPTKAAGDKPAAVNIATNDVTKFTVTGINNIVWLAGNQAALANALANAKSNHTVALSNDITMSGQWTPATTNGYTVDGRNHIISNMTITDCGKDYAGLIRFMSGGVVKNITVKDADIVYNSGAKKNARGGAIVGISYGGTIENCHAENVSIKGYQKMGGIVGYLAQSGNGFIVRNCSAKNISFTNNTTDLTYQAGGIIGYTLNYDGDILVEGCSVSDITINNLYDGSEGENTPYYCGTFIGSLDNQAEKEGLKIELKNNTISGTNTPQISHIYANTYFGWANNPEATSEDKKDYLATILIDGQEWTPNYPVKNVTKGKGYATLKAAVEDASAGDKITLEEGEYTLPNLTDITIEGIGDNVVVNHSSGSICATNNATIKNIVFNLGQNAYHGFQHASNLVLDGCTFNGFQNTYGSITYKNCTFNQDTYAYNMDAYGAEIVCENCVFNGKGKAVYVYDEGNDGMYHISFNGCVFNEEVGDRTECKAAILVKRNYPGQQYIVNINECTANFDKYVPGDPDFTGSALWNIEQGTNTAGADVKVYVDDVLMYDNAFLGLATKLALKNFAAAVNAGKTFEGQTVFLANELDLEGETITPIGTGDNKFKGTFDGKNKTIKNFVINNPEADDQGLFGPVFGATIKDLTIKNGQVTGKERVGALVGTGYMYVDNVTVDGCTVSGAEQAGGIAGFISSGSIKNCNINATITGATRAGGVVGKCQADNHFAIDGNTVKGTITSTAADGNYTAGGIACQIMWGQGSSIKNNVIDAEIICAGQKSNCPIGDYRAGGSYADMANGIVGNKWTKSKFTANQDSYTFTVGKPDGVDAVTTLNKAE